MRKSKTKSDKKTKRTESPLWHSITDVSILVGMIHADLGVSSYAISMLASQSSASMARVISNISKRNQNKKKNLYVFTIHSVTVLSPMVESSL